MLVAANIDSGFIETPVVLHSPTGDIFGTITTPIKFTAIPVALIIAGSGPTDRNGNNPYMKNNSLQQLAHGLAAANIASLRFDKRAIAASAAAGKNEADLRFDDYISDATAWIAFLRKDKRFSSIIIAGHSEGSLVGMITAVNADKFISLAGAGRSADLLLKEQLSADPELKDIAIPIIDSLRAGQLVRHIDPRVYIYFRPGIQSYLISWFKYDPQEEIKKLKIPVLILQGTNDLQVTTEDANSLAKAKPSAKRILIKDMNHVLKIVSGDRDANIKAYSDPSLPISAELLKEIIGFIKS
jgi:pimeloyl-ACP methyl ester carboxylesterase